MIRDSHSRLSRNFCQGGYGSALVCLHGSVGYFVTEDIILLYYSIYGDFVYYWIFKNGLQVTGLKFHTFKSYY